MQTCVSSKTQDERMRMRIWCSYTSRCNSKINDISRKQLMKNNRGQLSVPTLTVNVSWTEQCFIILEFCLSLSFSLLSISPSVDQIHVNTSGGRWKLRSNYFKDNDTLSSPFVRFCLFFCLFKNILMIKEWMTSCIAGTSAPLPFLCLVDN